MTSLRIRLTMPALFLALGVLGAGYFVGKGIADRSGGRRTISVKGLSEREFAASVAIWNLGYRASGNDLEEINRKLGESTSQVVAFLKRAGFEEQEMTVQPPDVRDLMQEGRGREMAPPPERYTAQQSVLLRTGKVETVKPAMASVSGLMMNEVLLSGGSFPSYVFDQLNEVKPDMIQEATHNARLAAEKFAHDSGTELGKLQAASQGLFQIEDRDPATPERKIVRVVVSVEYGVE